MTTIYEILKDPNLYSEKKIKITGWIRTNRDQKKFGFINLNDGSAFKGVQVVYGENLKNFEEVQKLNVGTSIEVTGVVLLTPNRPQPFEIQALNIIVLGGADETYPIQPKRHTREFLRENAHLRVRTNLFNAVFRVRSAASFAIHKFFKERNFVYVHTPLITASDGEGVGQMFNVTTLPFEKTPKTKEGKVDFGKDFFGKKTFLTVTGQLQAEAFAMGFRDVYTFGPTFRAEHSMTQRHLAEFWMIEPEMAFVDLDQMMVLIEDMVKYIVKYVLKELPDDMEFFNKYVDKGLLKRLHNILESEFVKITHREAIDILLNSGEKFQNKPAYGKDLGREHEKYLTDSHFSTPVFVTDWPKDIKAFYMRLNDDGETVRAVDLLVPGSGELVGGSQREERKEVLLKRMKEMKIPEDELWWYLDLRKYGGCVHSGFGMGFERMVMYLTGVENIRDVIPFPRTPNNAEF